MSAPTAQVDICNMALDHVGQRPISSIENPETDTEELCSRWYDQTRRSVLRMYVWNFAQKYRELARAGDGVGGYADAYDLPNDLVRLNGVGEDIWDEHNDYELAEGQLHLDNSGAAVTIRYNTNVTQVQKMDALFIDLLVLHLAKNLAYPLTKKKTVVEQICELIKEEERKIISVDGQERPPRRIQRSKYLRARHRGSRGAQGADSRYTDFS